MLYYCTDWLYYCTDCQKELDASGECWSDNPNALTHAHLGGLTLPSSKERGFSGVLDNYKEK